MMGTGDISPWLGEPRKETLLSCGKLAEECNELAGICARIMIQGLDECEPETKVPNREALMKEMSDVYAALKFVQIQTGVIYDGDRSTRKLDGYFRWFAMLRERRIL